MLTHLYITWQRECRRIRVLSKLKQSTVLMEME